MSVVPWPLYFPHLAPSDYFLFQKLNFVFTGKRSDDLSQNKLLTILAKLEIQDFQRCFNDN